MTTFHVPAGSFENVTPLGATPPSAGYYPVKIIKLENNSKDKAHTRRVHCLFDNGFSMFEFLHVAFDEEGNQYPGLEEKQVRGRLAALMTILFSLGFTKQDLANGDVDDSSLLYASNGSRLAYVEFIPGQRGVPGSYSTIRRFVTKAFYEANKDKPIQMPTAPAAAHKATGPRASGSRAPTPAGLPTPVVSAAQNLTR